MEKTSNVFDFVDYQNVGPIKNFLSVFTHARDRCFCDVRVCYKQMTVAVAAFSAALLIIKRITLRCKSFLNNQSL